MSKALKLLKLLFILTGVAFVALVIAVTIAGKIINVDQQTEALAGRFEQYIGHRLELSGNKRLSLLPAPALVINDVRLSANEEDGQPVFRAESVEVGLGWSVLWGEYGNANLHLVHPTLQINADVNGTPQLGWIQKLTRKDDAVRPYLSQVSIEGGTFHYVNRLRERNITLENIEASLRSSTQSTSANGTFIYRQQPLNFTYRLEDTVAISLSHHGGSNIGFEGAQQPDTGVITGQAVINIKNLDHFLGAPEIPVNSVNTNAAPITFMVSGDFTLSDDYFLLHRSPATVAEEKGTAAVYAGWGSDIPSIALDIDTDKLALQPSIAALAPHFLPQLLPSRPGAPPQIGNPLPEHINVSLLLHTAQAVYGHYIFPNFRMMAELTDGEVRIHEGSMQMEGSSSLELAGDITQGIRGLQFAGNGELQGSSLRDWLASHEAYAANLPERDFSDYSVKGNVFISGDQFRLSEATMQLGTLSLTGGVATYFEAQTRTEAEILLQDANLDYFRDTWQEIAQNRAGEAYAIFTRTGKEFDWLKRLNSVVDLKINLQRFKFLNRDDGKLATMRLYVSPGVLNLNGMQFVYEDDTLQGNFQLNVRGQKPSVDLMISGKTFDTDYFSITEDTSRPWIDMEKAPNQRWSDELFDFNWMAAFDGLFDISIGTLHHAGKSYGNFKCKAKLNNQSLFFEKLSFQLYSGTLEFVGTLLGGKVPTVSASFALYNADIQALLKQFFNVENITGTTSISGIVHMSGIHFLSWLKQGEIKMTMSGRGIRIKGLDMQSVIDVSQAARSTQDIAQGIRSRIFEGSTEFELDGNINLQQGIIKTPGIAMKYGYTLSNVIGEIDLLDHTANIVSVTQLPELSTETTPTLTVSIQGNIENYKTKLDTSSLEAWVAKRIVGQ